MSWVQAAHDAGLLPALMATRGALHDVTASLDAWLSSLTWPAPRLGLLPAADLRRLLALPAREPAAMQPFLPLLCHGAPPAADQLRTACLGWGVRHVAPVSRSHALPSPHGVLQACEASR